MRIVDSQVHIWTKGIPPITHHRQIPAYTKDDLLAEMKTAGVDKALLHPPMWEDGNRLAEEAVKAHPDRFAIVGFLDPKDSASREKIASWKTQPGMLGLRYGFLRKGEDTWLADGTMEWVWEACERLAIPVGLLVPNKEYEVAKIAERHPGLKIFIDHMARVRHTKDDSAFANLGDLLALAKYPNVAVKASALPAYSSAPYPYRNIHSHIRRCFDAFGPARFFWGTDITRLSCTYRQAVTMFTEEMEWLKGRDLDLVMGEALLDWFGWKTP